MRHRGQNREQIIDGVRKMLDGLGEDINRSGLEDTPSRVASAMLEMTSGYTLDAQAILGRTFPVQEAVDEMIHVGPIDFYSLCEHHLLPFVGVAHVAYLPGKNVIVGLSKLARVVDVFAKRLQVQERMTQQIALAINEALDPAGIGVLVKAKHLCMCARGVGKPRAWMTTTQLIGAIKHDAPAREEFLSYARNSSPHF